MADQYIYHDWMEQPTAALQLLRLKKHISEVALQSGASISGRGKSFDAGSNNEYLSMLYLQRDRLETETGASRTQAVNLADFGR